MMEDYQNIDTHECAISFVPNRVSNKALSMEAPQTLLKDFDNANFLCNSPYSLIDYRSVSLDTFGDYAKNSEYINF